MVLRKRVIISILLVPSLCCAFLFAEDQKQSNIPLGVWENSVTFSQETLSDYLPEEESDDIITARRFTTKYTTDEKNDLPLRFTITGDTRDYETQESDNKTIVFKAKFGKRVAGRNKEPLTQSRRRVRVPQGGQARIVNSRRCQPR